MEPLGFDSALAAPIRRMLELISPAFGSIEPVLSVSFERGPRLRCTIARSDPALQRGVQIAADGYDTEFCRRSEYGA